VLGGGSSGGLSTNPSVLGSAGLGSSSVYDSLGNGRMYSSRRSGSLERGGGMLSRIDDRIAGIESRISGGATVYGSTSGGVSGSRLTFDRAMDYDHGRTGGMGDYDRVDRGGSDVYGRTDVNTVFVKNVCSSYCICDTC